MRNGFSTRNDRVTAGGDQDWIRIRVPQGEKPSDEPVRRRSLDSAPARRILEDLPGRSSAGVSQRATPSHWCSRVRGVYAVARVSARFLALDLGAESGRAILGRLDGGVLTLKDVRRFPNVAVRTNGSLHWDILRLWHEVKTSLEEVTDV